MIVSPTRMVHVIGTEPAQAEFVVTGPYDVVRSAFEGMSEGRLVIVDRARFERLREFTEAALIWERAGMDLWHPEKVEEAKPRLFAARRALLPTDTDPLPEE